MRSFAVGEGTALLRCEEGHCSGCAAEASSEPQRDSTSWDPMGLGACTWASSPKQYASRKAYELHAWTCELCSWASREVQPYLDLVCKCLIFYLDLALDVQAIIFFMNCHEYQFALLNLLGILLSNVYTFVDMRVVVGTAGADAWEALTAGYLVPFNLHYAYLTGLTWASWQKASKQSRHAKQQVPLVKAKHPLLHCSRLAEALMEAFISSLVQSYALAHHNVSQKTAYFNLTQEQMVYFSLAFSFGNMGVALMGFDSAEGLHHLPGTGRSQATKLLVLVVRVAEVSSRITSIALFSVCTRGLIPLHFADAWPQPVQFLCKSFLLTAGPCLVLMDFLVLVVWIWASGGDTAKAFLSVLCCMNPLLEKGNPFSVRVDLYYALRLVEFLLAGCGVYYLVEDMEPVAKALEGNTLLVRVCLASTLICCILLPGIRYVAEPALLQEEILTEWSTKPFLEPQKRLLKALILSNPEELQVQVKAVIRHSTRKAAEDEASLGPFFQTCVNLKASLSDLEGRRFLVQQLEQVLQGRQKRCVEPKHLQGVLEVLAAASESDGPEERQGEDDLQQRKLEILLKLGQTYWKSRAGKSPEDFKKLLKAIDRTELLTKSEDATGDQFEKFEKNVKKLIDMWNSKFEKEEFEMYCQAEVSGHHWEAMTAWFTAKAMEKDFGSETNFLKKEADFLRLAGIISKAKQDALKVTVRLPNLALAEHALVTHIKHTPCGIEGGWEELQSIVTAVKGYDWVKADQDIARAEEDIKRSQMNEQVKKNNSIKKRAQMQEQHVKLQEENQKLQKEYEQVRKQNSQLRKGNLGNMEAKKVDASSPKAIKEIPLFRDITARR